MVILSQSEIKALSQHETGTAKIFKNISRVKKPKPALDVCADTQGGRSATTAPGKKRIINQRNKAGNISICRPGIFFMICIIRRSLVNNPRMITGSVAVSMEGRPANKS